MEKRIHKFTVLPKLPENLSPLHELAYNLWWTWNHEAVELFRMIDPDMWEKAKHNPVKMLGMVPQKRLEDLSKDDVFISRMIDVYNDFLMYKDYSTWGKDLSKESSPQIAYFSMEYGIHDSILMYSGGLGVLSGCHIKSSSEIGLPLVGVGLLYTFGGFNQYLTDDGWQMERYEEIDFTNIPVKLINDTVISVPMGSREVFARVWKMDVGRVSIFFLDTNFEKNSPEDRKITYYLYDGDQTIRFKQEILLGIGGIKLLEKLGFMPCVCHMNEGHSALLSIEKIIYSMKKMNMSFKEAKEFSRFTNIFTTHTPVPAGNEIFPVELVESFLSSYLEKNGIDPVEIIRMGKINESDTGFGMTVFALRNSIFSNGVSRLHGKISRKMWQNLWEGVPEDEVPIDHITNGVHINTWISDEFARLFNRYLNPAWKFQPEDKKIWERIDSVPDYEIWQAHLRLKERLISFVRERTGKKEVLDPDALTIGFARRFAEYKRALLIFQDRERLKRILTNKDRPVQIIIAGKSHQADTVGKSILKNLIQIIKEPEFSRKVVFVENYDLNVAKYLIQGVDVWLNNPRRPLEASGTSGMKASINGVLHLSVLDGWWDEAYNGENGWAIGEGEEYGDKKEVQDRTESMILYEILEREVVPLFYSRDEGSIPRGWVKKMKNAIKTIAPFFNTNRMVREYAEKFYIKAIENLKQPEKIKDFAQWKEWIREKWDQLHIEEIITDRKTEFLVGEEIEVRAKVRLGDIDEKWICVEIRYGNLDKDDNIVEAKSVKMELEKKEPHGVCTFKGRIKLNESGSYGFYVRITPFHEALTSRVSEGLIKIA